MPNTRLLPTIYARTYDTTYANVAVAPLNWCASFSKSVWHTNYENLVHHGEVGLCDMQQG